MSNGATTAPDPMLGIDGPALTTAPGSLARIFFNETSKNLLTLWAYRKTLIPELVLSAVTYIVLQFFIGGGELVDELLPATTLGYVVYLFTYYVLLKVVSGLLEEVNTGTLEQVHMSPLPSWALSVGRVGAAMIQGAVVTAVVGVGFVIGLGIDLPLRWQALVPAAVTVLDILGFALLVGGIALTVASIGAILHVIQGMVLIFNGSLVPVEAFPTWLEVLARLVPGTLGVGATHDVLLKGVSLGTSWSSGDLPLALTHAGLMLVAGSAVYQWNVRKGLAKGRLGP